MEVVMIRCKLARGLGSLALAGSLGMAAWAGEETYPSTVRIYRTGNPAQQSPEQSVPRTTESKDGVAAPQAVQAPMNGEAAAPEAAEEEQSVGWLQQHLNCSPLGSWLQCNEVKVAGWLSQGFTWNPDSPDNRFNFPMTFNDRSNEYQMNQFYLYAERAAKIDGCNWDCGWRIDVMYGTDYYFTESVGWELEDDGTQKWNSEDGPRTQFGEARLYGFAVPQLYAQVNAPIGNGVDIKIGHFYTPMGYEVVMAPGNFFYSHAYTFQYFEPFTHWGILANTSVNDSVKLGLGAVMGWDVLDDASDKVSVLGTVSWTSCDKNTTLFYGFMVGEEAGLLGNEDSRIYQCIYATHKLCDKVTSVTGSDIIWQNNGSFNNSGNEADAECYSIYQYLIYDINKCWSAGLRVEVTHDDDNLRVIPIGAGPAALGLPGDFAENATFTGVTAGLNYKPYENVRIRPELRWDFTDFNVGPLSAFDDQSDNNQFTASLDVVLTF
jgi:hypothetical protein